MKGQMHGKEFENLIKMSGLFPGSTDYDSPPTAEFDILARYDPAEKLPTSVKVTSRTVVDLADARRFFSIDDPYRMIVGVYKQVRDKKTFSVIHEIIFSGASLSNLRGALTFEVVKEMHEGLSLSKFPIGDHMKARSWAKEQKNKLSPKTYIVLNPKVDSKSQRRLQCSVQLADLITAAKTHIKHTDSYGSLKLPLEIVSSSRTFNKRSADADPPAPGAAPITAAVNPPKRQRVAVD